MRVTHKTHFPIFWWKLYFERLGCLKLINTNSFEWFEYVKLFYVWYYSIQFQYHRFGCSNFVQKHLNVMMENIFSKTWLRVTLKTHVSIYLTKHILKKIREIIRDLAAETLGIHFCPKMEASFLQTWLKGKTPYMQHILLREILGIIFFFNGWHCIWHIWERDAHITHDSSDFT